jgi:hypothetical protein
MTGDFTPDRGTAAANPDEIYRDPARPGATSPATESWEPTEEPQHPLVEAAHETAQTAGQLAHRASETGFQQVDQRREQAADAVDRIAQSIRRVSVDIGEQQPAIGNVVDTAAEQAERLAGYLRRTDARQMLDNVQSYARRQPLLFVGGAFLAGLAASRLMKAASGDSNSGSRSARLAGNGHSASRWASDESSAIAARNASTVSGSLVGG